MCLCQKPTKLIKSGRSFVFNYRNAVDSKIFISKVRAFSVDKKLSESEHGLVDDFSSSECSQLLGIKFLQYRASKCSLICELF